MAEKKTSGRDIRVDRVGLVNELYDLWAGPMLKKVKEDMARDGLILVEGDQYEGALADTTSSSIDSGRFFRLMESGAITKTDFLGAITVNRAAAKRLLAEAALAKISTTESGTPRFSIARKKGLTLSLREVIDGIAGVTAGLT